jgi:nitrogen fixation/metabolism regulation signal transduction histidine kinase
MIALVLFASALIAGITIFQYTEQAKDYHQDRLERKETQLERSILSILEHNHWDDSKSLKEYLENEVNSISYVQNINFNVYDLEGALLATGMYDQELIPTPKEVPSNILESLSSSKDRHVNEANIDGVDYLSSYRFVVDQDNKPLCILHLPYYQDNTFNKKELNEFLGRLTIVYIVLLAIAIGIAYLFSSFITKSFKTITDTLEHTDLDQRFKKIEATEVTPEMKVFIEAYNGMIDQLKGSAEKLAKSEREQAWREMAKQVAHEIKNPLTPMRLNLQLFEQQFDPNSPDAKEDLKEHTQILLEQIDTLSYIASAFSDFAQMPAQQNDEIDVNKITSLALSLFSKPYIQFKGSDQPLLVKFDRTQLIRIINNLVKNAIQACDEQTHPSVEVKVSKIEDHFRLTIKDNGKGIAPENVHKIFEPKFTTKSSGMGLGLGMVKAIVENYKGSISCESEPGKGSVFTIEIPIKAV